MVDDDGADGRRPLREMVEGEFLRDLVRARDEGGDWGWRGDIGGGGELRGSVARRRARERRGIGGDAGRDD